eukprot:COSAG01_NODE_41569_length_449_cov_17.880000_2_plen_23_part_01
MEGVTALLDFIDFIENLDSWPHT